MPFFYLGLILAVIMFAILIFTNRSNFFNLEFILF